MINGTINTRTRKIRRYDVFIPRLPIGLQRVATASAPFPEWTGGAVPNRQWLPLSAMTHSARDASRKRRRGDDPDMQATTGNGADRRSR